VRLLNGRVVVVAGVVLALVSLLAFSLSSPSTSIGADTDVDVQADDDGTGDVGAGAAPPASLPESGASGIETGGSTNVLLLTMMAALGVSLTGAGLMAARRRSRGRAE